MLEKYIENKRARFIMKRVLKSIPVVLLATIFVFLILRVGPESIARRHLGIEATPEMIRQFEIRHGLNQPLYIQYGEWVIGLFTGSLGTSIQYDIPVWTLVSRRLPITLQLMGLGLFISIVLGVTSGIISALKHNTWVDYVMAVQALFWRSAPSFWVGMIFLLIFSYRLDIAPPPGYGGFSYLILPAIVLGIRLQAIIARLTRSSMLDVLNKEYINTAKTKGLKNKIVITKHALRNALIPVVTIIALRLPWLFGGAMITEQVFNVPGMGRMIYTGTMAFDFPVVQSGIMIVTIVAVLANLSADILYTYIDPRIELKSEGL